MLTAEFAPYTLHFNFTAITSRQSMNVKDTYFVRISDTEHNGLCGIGEVALFRGLSADDRPDFESVLRKACQEPQNIGSYRNYSSIRFGIETAMASLAGSFDDSPWSKGQEGILINGLIWMGDKKLMAERIHRKLSEGFRCLKLKIGGINFDDELDLIRYIRKKFSPEQLELRLDANGSFSPENALSRLESLSAFSIHSIEQPIRAGNTTEMARICKESPIDIALDEELIGVTPDKVKQQMLEYVSPRYIILKPALCGGFDESEHWIDAASRLGIRWWATSALESNIGLAAIARWVSTKKTTMVQGLGTGGLYTNNIASPLRLCGDRLYYDSERSWGKIPVKFERP